MPDDHFLSQAEREFQELEEGVPKPTAPPFDPQAIIPERTLERAPEPVEAAPLGFTQRMVEQNILPSNWPEGLSVFQDIDMAMSSLSPAKQEILSRELLRFLPETERYRVIREIESETGGRIMPLTEEEWKLVVPKPNRNWLEKLGGAIADRGGTIFGAAMDALEWTSDRTEQALGYPMTYAWYNDVPDGYSRWELASLYYDIIGTSLQHGDFSGTYIKEVEAAMQRGEDWNSDDPENPGIMQRYGNLWADAALKIIYDPLWLVGGAGFIAKPLQGVKGMKKVGLIAEFGVIGGGEAPINLYKAARTEAFISKIPGVRRVASLARSILGPPHKLRAIEEAEARSMRAIERGLRFKDTMGTPSWWARLWKATPEHEADTLWRKGFTMFSQMTGDVRVRPEDMTAFFDAMRTGNVDQLPAHMPRLFAQNETAVALSNIFEAYKVRPAAFESLKKAVIDPTEYDSIMEEALAKSPKAAAKVNRQYARGHDGWRMQFLEEVNQRVYKAIAASYDIHPDNAMNKLFGLNKRLLSSTTLNTPSFVLLNGLNNFATMFFDYGFGVFRGGLRKSTMVRNLKNAGIDESVIVANAGDSALGQLVGVTQRVSKPGATGQIVRPSKFRYWVPFVSAATWLDGWARLKAFEIGTLRSYRHNWHKIAKPIPDELLKGMPDGMSEHLYALWDSSPEAGFLDMLDDAEKMIRDGAPPLHVGVLRERWLREIEKASGRKFEPAVRRLMKERFDQMGLVTHLQDTFRAASDPDDLLRRLDEVRVALRRDTDEVRKMQHLEPVGNLNDVQPAEDLAELTARRREIKNLIQEGRVTDPDEIARLEDEFADLDGRIRNARSAQGSTGENVYSIEVADDALGRTRVEMTDRWLTSHGVPAAQVDEYLGRTRAMYERLRHDRSRIFAAHQGGEKGIDRLWRDYEKTRLRELELNLDELETLITQFNPNLLPSFRVIRDVRMDSLRARDRALRMALEAGEDIRYYERADLMGPTRRRIHEWINQEVRTERDLMHLAPRPREYNMGMYEMPVTAEAITGENRWAGEFLDWAEPKMLNMLTQPPEGVPVHLRQQAIDWIGGLRGDYKDLQLTSINAGRAAADWTMLDYSRQYGIDKWLQWVFPYHFWPTRSMWRWAQRTTSNPGAVASIALSWDMMQEMTSDLPQRFEGDFELPIPFLGDMMASTYGPATKVFFNPIPMLFPTMQWAQDWSFESRQTTVAGRVLDWMSNNGPAVHPFLPIAGSMVGLLEREEWLNRGWPRSLPLGLPGTTAQMGVMAFLNGADVPLPDWLTDDDMGQLIGGSGLPLNKLQRLIGIPDDQWDTYRIDRMLAGLYTRKAAEIGPEASKELLHDYLTAMDTKSGPLWEEARELASKEAGIRFMSSWVFSPIQLYPEGEQMMRALDPVYRDYAARGQLEEFYERFPEYQTRRIALAGLAGPEERTAELHKSLFWLDLVDAIEARDRELKPVNEALAAIHEKEEFYNTKIGRTYRDLFEQEQAQVIKKYQDEVSQVYARYSDVDLTPSASHPPFTRALMSLRNDYYNIRLENYLPKGVTMEAATDEQVASAKEQYDKAQQDFLLDLPPGRLSATQQFELAVKHYARAIQASYQLSEATRENRTRDIPKIIDSRNADQSLLLDEAKSLVSRYDFNLFLNRGKQPPSAVQELYKQAGQEMEYYMAIGELTNVPTKMRRALQADWWETHPLLERFFGNEPVGFTTSEAASAYGRLMEIRETYYTLDGVARLDYIYSVLDEFNEILDKLGLPLVTLEQLKIGDERRWDLAIPGVGFPPAERLEYSIERRYSDAALTTE